MLGRNARKSQLLQHANRSRIAHVRDGHNSLKPQLLEAACAKAGIALTMRRQEGYDHSYFFIASFVEDHLRWHANALSAP